MCSTTSFTAGLGLAALAATASSSYVEYPTYENNNCQTVQSVSVYNGVPTVEGVQAADTCLDYEESTTTSVVQSSLTNGNGILSVFHTCNTTDPGQLMTTWYADAECDDTVAYEWVTDTCTASCTAAEPDFGSDEFEEATVSFFDSADCSNATATEVYTVADLYELFEVEDGTSCSPSGDFDFYTVIHCSDGAPAAVYYEDAACAADIVGMTYNPGCVPVPSNGSYPGDYFMAECTEEAVEEEESSDDADEEDTDAASGVASLFGLGYGSHNFVSSGVVAAASLTAAVVAFL
ncbi:unnamed protein product [Scytosiphon promiscuus]